MRAGGTAGPRPPGRRLGNRTATRALAGSDPGTPRPAGGQRSNRDDVYPERSVNDCTGIEFQFFFLFTYTDLGITSQLFKQLKEKNNKKDDYT